MSGRFIKVVPPPHYCMPPKPRGVGIGTLWQCDCDCIWELVKSINNSKLQWIRKPYRDQK